MNYTQICSSNLLVQKYFLPFQNGYWTLLSRQPLSLWGGSFQEIQASEFSAFFMCCYDQTVRAIPRGRRKTNAGHCRQWQACVYACVCLWGHAKGWREQGERHVKRYTETQTLVDMGTFREYGVSLIS